MRCRGHNVREWQRAWVHAGGHQPGKMGHIDHKLRADLVRDILEAREINLARVGRPASDDQLWLILTGQAFDLVEVNPAIVLRARHIEWR